MEDLSAVAAATFARNYQLHLKHLTLKGLQPKTVEAYSDAFRRKAFRRTPTIPKSPGLA